MRGTSFFIACVMLAAGCAAVEEVEEIDLAIKGAEIGEIQVRGGEGMKPCEPGLSVAVPISVSQAPSSTTTYGYEAILEVVDAAGRGRVLTRGGQLRTPATRIVMGWDGLVGEPADAVASAGSAELTLEVTVVRLSTSGGATKRTVLGSVRRSTSATVRPASARCAAWAALLPAISDHRGHLIVNGRETPLRPRIGLRNGRVRSIVGNLASSGRADLVTVSSFIASQPALFGDAATAQLRLEQVARDPSGVTRLVIGQSTAGGRRALDGRLVALFDARQNLFAIHGTVLENLSGYSPAFTYGDASAIAVVRNDLIARGFDPGQRTIAVVERGVVGAPGAYRGAYLIRVGIQPGTPTSGEDLAGFAYRVSSTTGAILDRWETSAPQWVDGSVVGVDVNDPAHLDPLHQPAFPPPYDPLCVEDLYNPNGVCPPLVSTAPPVIPGDIAVRLDAADASGQYHLSDGQAPHSVIASVSGTNLQDGWPTPDLAPASTPASLNEQHHVLLKSFALIQQAWDRYQPWLPASWPKVHLATGNGGGPIFPGAITFGSYSAPEPGQPDARIWVSALSADHPLRPDGARTAAHEIFHHFDEVTVALRRNPGGSMSTAIKEGLADFMSKAAFGAYSIDNVHHEEAAGPVSALVCLFNGLGGNDPWACWDDLHDRYRLVSIGFYPHHRPAVEGRSLLEPWPDCRTAAGAQLQACRVVPPIDASFPPTARDHRFTYQLIATTLLDAWESSTSAVAAGSTGADARRYAELFPELVLGAFVSLPFDANFVDLWFGIEDQVWLNVSLGQVLPPSVAQVPYAEVEDAFERHGIDFDLWQICHDPATASACSWNP